MIVRSLRFPIVSLSDYPIVRLSDCPIVRSLRFPIVSLSDCPIALLDSPDGCWIIGLLDLIPLRIVNLAIETYDKHHPKIQREASNNPITTLLDSPDGCWIVGFDLSLKVSVNSEYFVSS